MAVMATDLGQLELALGIEGEMGNRVGDGAFHAKAKLVVRVVETEEHRRVYL
jgi:hypothetical protein